jgi:hypothetical protein
MAYMFAFFVLLAVAFLGVSQYGLKWLRPVSLTKSKRNKDRSMAAKYKTQKAVQGSERQSEKASPETRPFAAEGNLNWKDVDPVKFRPFKSTYYITMGSTPWPVD